MPQRGAVVLLDEARNLRRRADRARALAGQLIRETEVIAALTSFASELEERASQLETQAATLQATIDRSHALTKEIERELAEAKKRLRQIGTTLGKREPDDQ